MSARVRIGVMGAAGEAAEGHIRGFLADPRAEVTTLWDIDGEGVRARAQAMGIPTVVDTVEDLVASPEVDAVVVATPDHCHGAHAAAALRAGKHVLCEKPMTTVRDDAAQLVDLVREKNVVFLGGHVYHFRPDYRLLVDSYRRGDIGEAWLVEGDYVSNLHEMYGTDGRTPWRSDTANPQDIMIGGGCHPMGLMRWLLQDEVVEVTAYSNHLSEKRLPLDDCYVAIMRFSRGAIGRLSAAAGSRGKVPDGGYIAVRGTTGSLWGDRLWRDEANGRHHNTLPLRDFGYETKHLGPRISDTAQIHYWAEQAQHFLDCIEGKADPMTSVLDSARVVAALTACVESARTGKPVIVDNEF